MYDRSMCRIAADRGETIHNVLRLLGTQGCQLVGCADLCHLLAGCQLLLQPTIELSQGNAIFHHRIAIAFDLCSILHAFQMISWRNTLYNHATFGNGIIERYVRLAHINEYSFVGRQMP